MQEEARIKVRISCGYRRGKRQSLHPARESAAF